MFMMAFMGPCGIPSPREPYRTLWDPICPYGGLPELSFWRKPMWLWWSAKGAFFLGGSAFFLVVGVLGSFDLVQHLQLFGQMLIICMYICAYSWIWGLYRELYHMEYIDKYIYIYILYISGPHGSGGPPPRSHGACHHAAHQVWGPTTIPQGPIGQE